MKFIYLLYNCLFHINKLNIFLLTTKNDYETDYRSQKETQYETPSPTYSILTKQGNKETYNNVKK